MRKDLKVVIGLLTLLIVFFLISLISTYKKISPFMENLFDNANNIENNQELTNQYVILYNLVEGRNDTVDFNSQIHLRFISKRKSIIKNRLNNNSSKNYPYDVYYIIKDSTLNYQTFLTKQANNLQLYFCDTLSLPFKYKKIIYPYNIFIENNIIIKAFVGNN